MNLYVINRKCCSDKNTAITKHYSMRRNSTTQMNTSNTRHFTLEFIEGILQVVRKKTFSDAANSFDNNTMSTVNSLAVVITNDQSNN